MTEDVNEREKYILRELKSIKHYEHIIKQLEDELNDIRQSIYDLGTPSSPLGNPSEVRIQVGRDKSSIVNDLLSTEQERVSEKNHMIECLTRAKAYKTKLLVVCDEQDQLFVCDYIRDVPYMILNERYGYSHAYDHMIRLIKKIK